MVDNFEKILEDIRNTAKSITKEEFIEILKEYNELERKSNDNKMRMWRKN